MSDSPAIPPHDSPLGSAPNDTPGAAVAPPDLSHLRRYPERARELLQAWDSADELLLSEARGHISENARVIALNDQFGALACGLALMGTAASTVYADSYVSARAISLNSNQAIQAVSDLGELRGAYDLALIQIPKDLAFLEDMLARLSNHLRPGARVLCGYRLKHYASRAYELIDRYIGPFTTTPAWKKARVIRSEFSRAPARSPYPTSVKLDGFAHPFTHEAHLFSRERLDIGTRFLLEHLAALELPSAKSPEILDLGCGNGVLGIAARTRFPAARLTFADDSAQALASARASWRTQFPEEDTATFVHAHAFEGQAHVQFDAVLCNPPFHQGTSVGDHIARQMFHDSRMSLKPGGALWVVGNSMLHYPALLTRIFGASREIARNRKFTLVEARRANP